MVRRLQENVVLVCATSETAVALHHNPLVQTLFKPAQAVAERGATQISARPIHRYIWHSSILRRSVLRTQCARSPRLDCKSLWDNFFSRSQELARIGRLNQT
jgi:hypothetical protein